MRKDSEVFIVMSWTPRNCAYHNCYLKRSPSLKENHSSIVTTVIFNRLGQETAWRNSVAFFPWSTESGKLTELLLYCFEALVAWLQANPILPDWEEGSGPKLHKLQVRAFPALSGGTLVVSWSYSTLYKL